MSNHQPRSRVTRRLERDDATRRIIEMGSFTKHKDGNDYKFEVTFLEVPDAELGTPNNLSADGKGKSQPLWFNIGDLPQITLGAQFLGNEYVGHHVLPLQFFSLDLSSQRILSSAQVSDRLSDLKVRSYEFGMLNWVEVEAISSIGGKPCLVLIPCIEVFRRYYAFSTKFVNAMAGGPWNSQLHTVVNLAASKKVDRDNWTVVLRRRFTEDAGLHAALFVLDDFGMACAKTIQASLASTGRMEALIPSKRLIFGIEGRGIELKNGVDAVQTYAITRLTRSDFPLHDDVAITVIREESETPPKNRKADAGTTPNRGTVITVELPEDEPTDPNSRAASSSPVFPREGVADDWGSLPRLIKMKSDKHKEASAANRIKKVFPDSSTRPPENGRGDSAQENLTKPGSTNALTVGELLPRMQEVLNAFESLKLDNRLTYEVVQCPDEKIVKSNLSLWSFATTIEFAKLGVVQYVKNVHWGWLDNDNKIPRGALVLEIAQPGIAHSVYWLEIESFETAGSRQYQSLVFRISDTATIYSVLKGMFEFWRNFQPAESRDDPLGAFGEHAHGQYWKHSRVAADAILGVITDVAKS